jgi:hypothetical protein
MANDKRRKEDKRREQEERAIVEALRQDGRAVVHRVKDGSVRTVIWLNRKDLTVPAMIEQYRLYSTGTRPGVSRFLEASDIVHALRGLGRAETYVSAAKPAPDRPPELPEKLVREAIDRGSAPVEEAPVHGNVAANWFTNPFDYEIQTGKRKGEIVIVDYVSKIEPLAVNKPGIATPYFWSGQIPEMRQCLLDVVAGIDLLHRKVERGGHLGPESKAPSADERGPQGA